MAKLIYLDKKDPKRKKFEHQKIRLRKNVMILSIVLNILTIGYIVINNLL